MFHQLPPGSATFEQVLHSSAGIEEFARFAEESVFDDRPGQLEMSECSSNRDAKRRDFLERLGVIDEVKAKIKRVSFADPGPGSCKPMAIPGAHTFNTLVPSSVQLELSLFVGEARITHHGGPQDAIGAADFCAAGTGFLHALDKVSNARNPRHSIIERG